MYKSNIATFVCVSVCLCVCVSVCLCVYVRTYVSIMCLCVCVSVCLCLSVCMSQKMVTRNKKKQKVGVVKNNLFIQNNVRTVPVLVHYVNGISGFFFKLFICTDLHTST